MTRIHRSLVRRASKIDADKVAYRAEDYLEILRVYKKELDGMRGVASSDRVRKMIKKIDDLEREVIRLEQKIETLLRRRAIAALKLKDELDISMDFINECLEEVEE